MGHVLNALVGIAVAVGFGLVVFDRVGTTVRDCWRRRHPLDPDRKLNRVQVLIEARKARVEARRPPVTRDDPTERGTLHGWRA